MRAWAANTAPRCLNGAILLHKIASRTLSCWHVAALATTTKHAALMSTHEHLDGGFSSMSVCAASRMSKVATNTLALILSEAAQERDHFDERPNRA